MRVRPHRQASSSLDMPSSARRFARLDEGLASGRPLLHALGVSPAITGVSSFGFSPLLGRLAALAVCPPALISDSQTVKRLMLL